MLVNIVIHTTSAHYLCQELLGSSLLIVLPLPQGTDLLPQGLPTLRRLPLLLEGYLRVVAGIKRPDAQKLAHKQRKNHNVIKLPSPSPLTSYMQ
jgi:urea transporter